MQKDIAYYEQILHHEPSNIDVRIHLASIWRELGDRVKAVEQYAAVARLLTGEGLILEAIAAAPPGRAQWLSEQVAAWELELARVSRPAPGAHGLLEYLRSRGTQLGVVTRNRRDIARLTLDVIGLEQFFRPENILGRDEAPPKPSPQGIQYLMSNWQADGGVMVGDYRYDLEAGRAAGCFTIHVARSEQSAWQQWTDLHVVSLEILLARLMSLGD